MTGEDDSASTSPSSSIAHRPGRTDGIHPGVGIPRVHEDLLVLLEPGVQAVPFEADHSRQARYRILAVHPGRAGPEHVPGLNAVPPCGTAAEPLWVLLVDQRCGINVGERNVVLRIVRPLPDVDGAGGVQDGVGADGGADPSGYRFHVVDRGDHRRVVGHVRSLPSSLACTGVLETVTQVGTRLRGHPSLLSFADDR